MENKPLLTLSGFLIIFISSAAIAWLIIQPSGTGFIKGLISGILTPGSLILSIFQDEIIPYFGNGLLYLSGFIAGILLNSIFLAIGIVIIYTRDLKIDIEIDAEDAVDFLTTPPHLRKIWSFFS